jgi:ABC-type Mn2+/Zn2+ transport system ATPase subunit
MWIVFSFAHTKEEKMRVMKYRNLDAHDRRRFTELVAKVDVDSARNTEFDRLSTADQKAVIAAWLRRVKKK